MAPAPNFENVIDADEWRTIKRVLPRDLYMEWMDFEAVVGEEIGSSVSLGASVAIWSILTHLVREHKEELRQLAREWRRGE